MANLAKYIVQLEAQTQKYRTELDRANKKLSRFHRTQGRALKGIRSQFLKLAPAVSAVSFAVIARQSIDAADKINKLTDRLGGTTEAWSELGFVGERSGVKFETLSLGLQRMSRRVAEAAQGTGEAKGALRELGLDAAELAKLPLDKQFESIAEQLSKVEGASDKTRLAMKLFDSEGVALLQTMKGGAAGIAELRAKARELGVTLDTEAAQKATKAKDAMLDFSVRVESAARNITLALVPALTEGIGKLERFTIGLAAAFAGAGLGPYGREIIAAEKQLESLQRKARAFGESKLFSDEQKDQLLNDILDTSNKITELRKKAVEELTKVSATAAGGGILGGTDQGSEGLDAFLRRFEDTAGKVKRELAELEKFRGDIPVAEFNRIEAAIRSALDPAETGSSFEQFIRGFETTAQKVERELAELNKYKADLPVEEFERIQFAIESALIEPIKVFVKKKPASVVTDELRKIREAAEEANRQARELGQTFASAFEDAILEGEKFRDVIAALIKDLARIALRRTIIEPFVNAFSSFITGRKAAGGAVLGGGAYLVGEQGPEVFMPASSGSIIPNSRLGGGGNVFNFTTNINSRGGLEPEKLIPILEENNRKVKGEFLDELNRGKYD